MVLQAISDDPTFCCTPVKLPGIPKTQTNPFHLLKFAFLSSAAVLKVIRFSLLTKSPRVFLALSQTKRTLTREKALLFLVQKLTGVANLQLACRLDSSLFTTWPDDSSITQQFRRMLQKFEKVAALGPKQHNILKDTYGMPQQKLEIIPNTCEVQSMTRDEIIAKHSSVSPVRVLHLSSLMEPKGFADLVDAVQGIDNQIQVTICGKLTQTEFDRRFDNLSMAESFLKASVNRHANLTWIPGAVGLEKQKLFDEAHVFVLPTWYPVESQPLVLLEAIACGCTVVSSDIGEVPLIVDSSSALILNDTKSETIATAISALNDDPQRRINLAVTARQNLQQRFSEDAFRSSWKKFFHEVYGCVGQ
jgi:glycosyltransferase involved in cell wall biosynthesis